ncbi:Serine/threonine-protein kinase STY8 [Favolaschia claudopus]|uniref:Serine/threonine-protein kinase STY8 n=1 Tax=Favolaschia claudopus TaxID=2862362 RepID=A0AAW0BZY9_9AGAR
MYTLLKIYGHIWLPATIFSLALLFYGAICVLVEKTVLPPLVQMLVFVMLVLFVTLRGAQIPIAFFGQYFTQDAYNPLQNMLLVVALWGTLYTNGELTIRGIVCICYNAALCIFERCFLGDKFRQFMLDKMIVDCMRVLVSGDSISFDESNSANRGLRVRLFSRVKNIFRRKSTGPIALPADDAPLELGSGSEAVFDTRDPRNSTVASPRITSSALTENILHWSRLSKSRRHTLWMTTVSSDARHDIVRKAMRIFSSTELSDKPYNVFSIDLTDSKSVYWPIIHGFASASAEYRKEIGQDPPPIVARNFSGFYFNIPRAKESTKTWSYYDDDEELVQNLLVQPIISIYKQQRRKNEGSNSDIESAEPVEVTRTVLLLHGVRSTEQAQDIWSIADILRDKLGTRYPGLGLVIVSTPRFLRHVAELHRSMLECICTMFISDTESVLYSGITPPCPVLHENIFQLLVHCVHRVGGPEAEKVWPKVLEISQSSHEVAAEASLSTAGIFSRLYQASKDRQRILECLPEMSAKTRAQIPKKIKQDNIKIAGVLLPLFDSNSYKKDIADVPREHASAALEMTHSILDTGLPEDDMISDEPQFLQRAQRLMNFLAAHLGMLPVELSFSKVTLLSDYPVAHGGFANIYHGKYTDSDGQAKEVALKVLKIFEDQSEERRRILNAKFFREALAWHYLNHRNIVRFLGVESTIFPSPFRAMVSPWMPQGSVLKYMAKHSPSSPYAIELLRDTIKGLRYLHRQRIVHGDLCGRNILIDENGRARLTDFGLSAFAESDTTRKTSAQSGSTRWMSPELIVPPSDGHFRRTFASDIWAFGCVCCEIWSEGVEPFSQFAQETVLIIAFSGSGANMPQRRPYQTRPSDKEGVLMPERLWEFVQMCWEVEPSERPTAEVIADVLSELKHVSEAEHAGDQVPEMGIASGSGTTRTSSIASAEEFEAEQHSSPSLKMDKGKQVRFEEEYAVVRFGPLTMDTDAEEAFFIIFESLAEIVPRGALAEPRLIYAFDSNNLQLHFRSPMEANNFCMTWTVHRFEPYLQCGAAIVDP